MIEGIDYKKIDHKIYKYELLKPYSVKTDILSFSIFKSYFSINQYGLLTARIGYRWNGASCCPDLDCLFEGALPHDVLYQMLQEGIFKDCFGFNFNDIRLKSDILLYSIWIKNKTPRWFAYLLYCIVRGAGKHFAKEK